MASTVQKLYDRGLIQPPSWLPNQVVYETMMGSVAYGVSSDTSDVDVYGICIPPLDLIFPHLAGEIPGFGNQIKRFEQYQQHHVFEPDSGKQYDFQVFGLVKFFQLAMENNPNVVDAIFTPADCVLSVTAIGNMIRDNRDLFLNKKCWHTFKGYAYSQLAKLDRTPEGKRKEVVAQFGFDVKFAYHVVRLMDEVEQILTTGTFDMRRNREHLKAIRRGDVPEREIREYFALKEKDLERLYNAPDSPIPYKPREKEIKRLLMDCLEHHYGSLERAVVVESRYERFARDVRDALTRLEEK